MGVQTGAYANPRYGTCRCAGSAVAPAVNTLQKRHTDKMEAMIAQLPPQSHPKIRILPR